MIGQGQQLKQTQRLSPIQIQAIKILELPALEMEELARNELDSNPCVEEVRKDEDSEARQEDLSLDATKASDDIPGYRLREQLRGRDPDDNSRSDPFVQRDTSAQSLIDQIECKDLSEHEKDIARFIIGSLNEHGYLDRDISSLTDDMEFRAGIGTSDEEVERMVAAVQELEPAGIAARDLKECLLLQLRTKDRTDRVRNATAIVSDHFEDFAAKRYSKIMQRLGIDETQFKDARACIRSLNPYPGGQFTLTDEDKAQQIVPDFVLTKNDNDEIDFTMPRARVPEVRISSYYKERLEEARMPGADKSLKEAAVTIKDYVSRATNFVEAMKQRQNTLKRTMKAIMDYQHNFFESGDEADLKPLILETIANQTGYDISTISRVANSKYIETPFGIFPLKFFFTEGLVNAEGETVSTREIKKVLGEIIDAEDKKDPLTDEALVDALTAKGYIIARRTVAKYRDQLGIPTARLRRETL